MSVENILKIKIRKMTTSDIDSVAIIEELAYGEHHWSKSSFYDEMSNQLANYYVVELENKIIAYAGMWNVIDEGHITTIAVNPKYQKQHIGESLILKILKNCYENKIKYLTLEVRESNIPAINLYKKYGFDSLGTRKGYYQDNNENALVMWTENIFYDKFKNIYNKNVLNMKDKIIIE